MATPITEIVEEAEGEITGDAAGDKPPGPQATPAGTPTSKGPEAKHEPAESGGGRRTADSKREARVQVVDNGGAALQVTTESGATVLAEVVRPAVEGGRWTLIEMHPTGMGKPSSHGSCHEALGRAVKHALSRARRG